MHAPSVLTSLIMSADREYLESQGVEKAISEAISQALKERPANALNAIASAIAADSASASKQAEAWGGMHEEVSPTVHHVPGTISSPIVQCVIELGCVEKVKVNTLTFAELKQPSHLAVNPMGTVRVCTLFPFVLTTGEDKSPPCAVRSTRAPQSPAFSDGPLSFWESGAVLTHILETHDREYILHPPPCSALRPKFLWLHSLILATVYPFVAGLFLHTLKPAQEQDPAYVASGKTRWRESFAPVLVRALGEQPFLLGERLSAVDLLLAKPLRNANSLGVLEEFQTLANHFNRVSELPSFAVAYAIEKN